MAAHDTQQRSPSFGRLEQRELEYMKLTQVPADDRWLYSVLKVRYDVRSGAVVDRLPTLMSWSGLPMRTVQRSLASLKRRGIIRRAPRKDPGRERGHAFSYPTYLEPYEQWPTEPLWRLCIAMQTYADVFHRPSEASATVARSSTGPEPKNAPTETEERANGAGRTRQPSRDNPDSFPDSFPASSAGETEQDEDARLDGSRPPGNPLGASRGGTPGKDEEVVLAELGEADYDLVESRDRPFIAEYMRTHPLVDVADEIAKWAAQDGPRTFNGLAAWLAHARPADRTRKRDPYCVEPGCLDRGRGDLQRCVRHLGLAS